MGSFSFVRHRNGPPGAALGSLPVDILAASPPLRAGRIRGPDGWALLIKRLDCRNWGQYVDRIAKIEEESYEPARRDSPEFFFDILRRPRNLSLVALLGERVAGFCFGAPLECFPQVEGTRTDPQWGKRITLYSADLAVAPRHQGKGIAYALKRQQLRQAWAEGYWYVAGRNRVGFASAMMALNARFGAHPLRFFRNSYNDDIQPNICLYYHIDLRKIRDELAAKEKGTLRRQTRRARQPSSL